MPLYCFSTEDGRVEEQSFPMGQAPSEITLEDGTVAVRDFAAEHAPRRAGSGYPFDCFALGVHPEQVGELRKTLDANGCKGVAISRDGDPIISSRTEYARVKRALGVHERNSYTR